MTWFARLGSSFGVIAIALAACTTAAPPGPSTAARIAAGDYHSVRVVPADGAAAWGFNGVGQVGDGTTTQRNAPVSISTPANSTLAFVSAGDLHTVALDRNGVAWAWGQNINGQLGDGTTTDRWIPTQVTMPPNTTFHAISAGYRHTIAIDQDGAAWAWGRNSDGQLGDGTTTQRTEPTLVAMPSGTRFTAVAAGEYHSVALDEAGNAWGWGYNGSGQLGDGSSTTQLTPVMANMPLNTTFTGIAAKSDQVVAIDQNGNGWGWGENNFGQLGNATTVDSSTPSLMDMPPNTQFERITMGVFHAAAIDQNGNVWTWGRNVYGQLGNGTTADSYVPMPISMPPDTSFAAIAAGYNHTLAMDTSQNTWGWGGNQSGQVGDGTTTNRSLPTLVGSP